MNNIEDIEKALIEEYNKNCPVKIRDISSFVEDFNPAKNKYKKSLIGQGYIAARMSKSGSLSVIAKKLGLPYPEFKHYMENYDEFAVAIRRGIIDGNEDIKTQMEETLINRAKGLSIEEKTQEGVLNDEGEEIYVKVKKVTKQLPPDTQAIMEILKHLDPTWNTKQQVDVNVNTNYNLNVTEDRNVNIDLRMLSPEALREIIDSNNEKLNPRNPKLNKREDDKSVLQLKDCIIDVDPEEKKPRQNVKGKRVSEETKDKMSKAKKERHKIMKETEEQLNNKLIEAYTNNED